MLLRKSCSPVLPGGVPRRRCGTNWVSFAPMSNLARFPAATGSLPQPRFRFVCCGRKLLSLAELGAIYIGSCLRKGCARICGRIAHRHRIRCRRAIITLKLVARPLWRTAFLKSNLLCIIVNFNIGDWPGLDFSWPRRAKVAATGRRASLFLSLSSL